jgi:hypothetical protein
MDDSMNSVHSTSAMDISPASSPIMAINPIPSNHLLLNAFQQQQELLSNILVNASNINKHLISDEYENNSKSLCLYSTVLTDNNDEIKSQIIPDESNQFRQRIIKESIPSIIEPIPIIKKPESNSSQRSFNKTLLFIPILLFVIYFIVQHLNTSIVLPRSSNWQNASEYLIQNLIGQDQGLQEFKDTMEKHKNFSIVLIEVIIDFYKYLKSINLFD